MATWPTLDSTADYLGRANVGTHSLEVLAEMVDTATEMVRSRIDTDKLPEDDDVCPATIRTAIHRLAGQLLGLRDARNGRVSEGDMAVTAAQLDRDLTALLWEYRLDPEP